MRERCTRCGKLTRPKNKKYHDRRADEGGRAFCSFNCMEWFRLESAQRYLAELRAEEAAVARSRVKHKGGRR